MVPVCDLPRHYCGDERLLIGDLEPEDRGYYTPKARNKLAKKTLDYETRIGSCQK